MAITYPLTIPGGKTPRQLKLSAVNLTGEATSPYTGQQQLQQWPGEWWEIEWAMPQMTRHSKVNGAGAAQWMAFLKALRGKGGTFLAGDPLGIAPNGTGLGAPVVAGLAADYSKPPVSGVNVGAGGGLIKTWSNPINIGSPTSFAQAGLGLGDSTVPLYASSFGFAIPATGVVVGIELTLKGYSTAQAPVISAQMVLNGVPAGAAFPQNLPVGSSPGNLEWGGATNLWGMTSIPLADINLANFGFYFIVSQVGGACNVFLDDAVVQVFMSTGGGPQPAGTISLPLRGLTPNQALFLDADDYLQVGGSGGLPARLYSNLTPAATDANGNVTLDIFPATREAYPDGTPVILKNAVGTFRLANDRRDFSLDSSLLYGITFKAREAI